MTYIQQSFWMINLLFLLSCMRKCMWKTLCVFLQVVVEGIADRRSLGYIAVDNIQIMDGVRAEDCKGVYFNVT